MTVIMTNPMSNLYSQLSTVGIVKSFAKKVLPEWWDDEIADSASGLQQAQLYFSRAFNLDIASLQAGQTQPKFHVVERKFKLSGNVSAEDVSVGAHYVTAIAKLALQTIARPQSVVPKDPNELRLHIINKYSCVNLDGILSYCAEVGIPVIHVEKVPGKKMTGLVARIDGRFAIVISKKGHPAYQLFYLAHELGHIANEHLTENGFIGDESIGSNDKNDADEKEADAYAIRLLNGNEVKYTAQGTALSPKKLFLAAKRKGEEKNVDIGHIILNFGNSQKNMPLANMALREVAGSENGAVVINQAFFSSLNEELLSDDQLQLLKIATGYNASTII